MTDLAQWRTQIDEMFSESECTGPRCNHETADKHYLLFDSDKTDLLALLATVQAETDRESRIDELMRVAYVAGFDKPRNKAVYQKYLKISYVEKRLATLNQKAEV